MSAMNSRINTRLFTGFLNERMTFICPYLSQASSHSNSCLNLIKHINIREEYKTYNELEIKNEEEKFEDSLHTSELELKIRETIDLLPTERRKVFILSRFEGLKYKEIAEKQNISIKTVENQMGKAIKFLREHLSEYIILVSLVLIAFIYKIFK